MSQEDLCDRTRLAELHMHAQPVVHGAICDNSLLLDYEEKADSTALSINSHCRQRVELVLYTAHTV